VGGYLTQPFEAILKSESSVSLSPTGGHVAARVESVKLDTAITSGPAYAQATGSVHKATGNWTTSVTAVVENLSVYSVVTADKIVSQISVEHRRSGGHPSVSFVGSQFENLRINGKPYDAPISPAMLPEKAPAGYNGGDVARRPVKFPDVPWPEEPGFAARAEAKNHAIVGHEKAPDWLKDRYRWMTSSQERAKRGFALCSLVETEDEQPEQTGPDTAFGHVVCVPGFGNIFLAELIVTQHAFHLTMLRIEMGCLADGNVSFASTRGNGSPMPGGG
jgi:hypothetical protein